MDKEQLLKILKNLQVNDDPEFNHKKADFALLEYINDDKIWEAYRDIEKWYA